MNLTVLDPVTLSVYLFSQYIKSEVIITSCVIIKKNDTYEIIIIITPPPYLHVDVVMGLACSDEP